MPRIENNSDKNLDEIEKKLEQIESRVKRSNRRFFSCFNCLIYFLILLGVGGYFIAKLIAQSGLVSIPIFTEQFYTEPAPSRVVTVASNAPQQTILEQIKAQIATAKPQEGKSATITVAVSERDMTRALAEYVNRNEKKYEQAQIAVVSDGLEVFLKKPESKSPITIVLVPEFTESGLSVRAASAKIGLMPLPTSMLNWLMKVLFSDGLNRLNTWLKDFSHIQGVRLEGGALLIDMQILTQGTVLDAF